MDFDTYFVFPSIDWDPHTFAVEDLHQQLLPLDMEHSPVSSQASTGYLQDAVVGWSDRCKRRRVASPRTDNSTPVTKELQDLLLQGFWDSNCYSHPLQDLKYCMLQEECIKIGKYCMLQEECIKIGGNYDPLNILLTTAKTQAAAAEVAPWQLAEEPLSSSCSYEELLGQQKEEGSMLHLQKSKDIKPSHAASKVKALTFEEQERKQLFKRGKTKMRVAYPFAVVKPGGVEGDVTLDDINARLLRRPRRPVRHPVGDYANGPRASADGPGPSGKAIVSLTRIQTQGNGTITIIRTKG